MRLLVSVRTADEVPAALDGGADIIDAKEPANGSLGAVPPAVLGEIAARVPPDVPFSAALGDFSDAESVSAAVAAASPLPRLAPVYLKLGFAGEGSPARARTLIAAAIGAAGRTVAGPAIVPVAYADWSDAGSPAPEEVLTVALEAGARTLLLDTYIKDGRGLFDRVRFQRVAALAARCRNDGVGLALAGSLDLGSIHLAAGLANVVGVRSAACIGGREGRVEAALVRGLRERLLAATRVAAAAG